jgi:ABC-type multidrug transport system ATPase subunit
MDTIAINVVDVTQHYGIKPVLRDVNLQVKRGEVLALMGPNGTGKSTLMQVMAGVISPYRGYCEIDGIRRRQSEDSEVAIRKVAVYLPAEPWVPRGMTGREWLLAVGRIYNVEFMRLFDHVDRLLILFDLVEKGDSPISSYSTGQLKKISLAGALVTEASIFLLDEPFSGGLDPSGILAMRRVLQQLAATGSTTIVLATPVPELVEELANRVAILRDGKIQAHDTIEGLRKLAGGAQRLDEVYHQLANPGGTANIDQYFQRPP